MPQVGLCSYLQLQLELDYSYKKTLDHEKEVCVAKKAMNILIWETKQLNKIKCDQCDSWFDRKSQLEKHTQELHNQNSTKHTIDRKPSLQKID